MKGKQELTMKTFKIETTDSQCTVTWRHYSGIVLKWILFVVLWGFFCLMITEQAFDGDPYVIFGAFVFWGGWFYAWGLIGNALFGKTTLILNDTGLKTTWTCLSFKREKQIDLNTIRCFDKIGISTKLGRWYCKLRVVGNGRNVHYFLAPAGFLTPANKELDAACDQLNIYLKMLKDEVAAQSDDCGL
ncbi:MAG: hypothetical protein LBI05_08595 [Planctomycetaceae bacterium]|jgi:hypothetical protein|nr:hypothetical protein [Planctomycetaceae bacterium]